jgi:NADH-quinone oxidoreductase subunit M
VGEFLILSGTWLSRLPSAGLTAAIGATGVVLGAVYMLYLVQKVFFGKLTNPANRHLADLSVREAFVIVPMVALIGVMGLLPQPFLAPAKPAVDRLIGRMAAAEARLRQGDPGLPPLVGTEPAALALSRPALGAAVLPPGAAGAAPAPADAPAAPAPGAPPAPGSH